MNVTAVVGTPGYMDPAYVQSQYATPSADVYRCVEAAFVASSNPLVTHLCSCKKSGAKKNAALYPFRHPLS